MIMDLHTHTHHSFDGENETVAERILCAGKLGLRYMAITDHVEINRWFPAKYYGAKPPETPEEAEMFPFDGMSAFLGSLAETHAETQNCTALHLLCGTEIGQIPQCPELAAALYADPRLDLVIGSIHELPNRLDFFYLDYARENVPALIRAYFEEVLRLAETGHFDILAHLTYGLRYIPNRESIDLSPYYPTIDEIFRRIIADDRALELNGSGLKNDPAFTDPGFPLLCRYRKMGGRRLTLSTDAHASRRLGYRMGDLEQMAREAGFTELTVYSRHVPEQIRLS